MSRARRESLATLPRQGLLVSALAALLGATSACGGLVEEELALPDDAITVRPRVAIDGLIELSARTGGRLFVDEVVFHAPAVQIQDGPSAIADLLASDPQGAEAVLFRYSLADGSGAAVASERRWHLTPSGVTPESEVSFGFAPFEPTRAALDEALARTGWDLSALAGYTAYVHGYVSVAPTGINLHQTKGSFRHDERMAGDSEGDPAHGDEKMAGDAEGDPARVRDGERMAGDSEGDPARGSDDERMAGDAEGDPAKGRSASDPEGDPAKGRSAGDPEGDPAEGHGYKGATSEGRSGSDRHNVGAPGAPSDGQLVPFLLVFEGHAELSVPLAELGIAELKEDEYLPINLHVDVNRLLPDQRLEDLDQEAASVVSGTAGGSMAVLEVDQRDMAQSFVLDLDAVQKRKPTATAPRLELTGDPRK